MEIPSPQAYTTTAPGGVPGDITRAQKSNVEPILLVEAGSPLAFAQLFGIPLKYGTGGASQFVGGETKADFAGVLARSVPSISGNTNAGLTDNTPNPVQVQNMLVAGYINVKCTHGTPARGGVVYVRTVGATDRPIGAFEADADGGNSFALDFDQASWATDGLDADGNAEIRVGKGA